MDNRTKREKELDAKSDKLNLHILKSSLEDSARDLRIANDVYYRRARDYLIASGWSYDRCDGGFQYSKGNDTYLLTSDALEKQSDIEW